MLAHLPLQPDGNYLTWAHGKLYIRAKHISQYRNRRITETPDSNAQIIGDRNYCSDDQNYGY